MKQVVENILPSNVITIEKVSVYKYYGIDFLNIQRSFITRSLERDKSVFVALCIEEITRGLVFSYKANDLMSFIKSIIKDGHKVYQFDNKEQLFKWLVNKGEQL